MSRLKDLQKETELEQLGLTTTQYDAESTHAALPQTHLAPLPGLGQVLV